MLSMIHGSASHYFKKLTFTGDAFNGSGGILKGIKDSFFYIGNRPTMKTFYIDELEGPNDISLIQKAIRIINNEPNRNPIEKELPEEGKKITLRNVLIGTKGDKLQASIRFQYNNTAWQFVYNSTDWINPNPFQKRWNFTKIDANNYEKTYLQLKSKIFNISPELQKPLVTILKEKQAKYLEIKKQSMINTLSELSSTLNQLASTEP